MRQLTKARLESLQDTCIAVNSNIVEAPHFEQCFVVAADKDLVPVGKIKEVIRNKNSFECSNILESRTNTMLKTVLKELKDLCQEIKELKVVQSMIKKPPFSLKLPIKNKEDFLELEEKLRTDRNLAAYLSKLLRGGVSHKSMVKYVRGCLRHLINDEAASNFSWCGQNDNIPVQSYTIVDIIKDCTLKKFPNARSGHVVKTIKTWFIYAKDRHRKLLNYRPLRLS